MRLRRKEVIIRLIMWLCTMGFIISRGIEEKILKGFDLFAIIFIFILMLIDDTFFSHRGKIFTFIMVFIPILIWFYISYNFVDDSVAKKMIEFLRKV